MTSPDQNYAGVFGIGEPGVGGDGVYFSNGSGQIGRDISDAARATRSPSASARHSMNFGRGYATWTGNGCAGSLPLPLVMACAPGPEPLSNPDKGTCIHEDGSGMTLRPHQRSAHGPGSHWVEDVNQ